MNLIRSVEELSTSWKIVVVVSLSEDCFVVVKNGI